MDAILKNKFGPIREIHTSSNSGMLDSLRLFEEPFFESDIICSHEMVWYMMHRLRFDLEEKKTGE